MAREVNIVIALEKVGKVLTFVQTGLHSAGTCMAGLQCLDEKVAVNIVFWQGIWAEAGARKCPAPDEGDGRACARHRVTVAARVMLAVVEAAQPLTKSAMGEKRLTRPHMPCDMLWPGEGRVAYGTLDGARWWM